MGLSQWVAGRAGRREYWVYVALLMAISFVVSFLPGYLAGTGLSIMVAFVQVRRLHDMNRSGWWALGVVGAPIVLLLVLARVNSLDAATLGGEALVLVLLIGLGALPGTPGENRFGPPAPFSWSRILQGR